MHEYISVRGATYHFHVQALTSGTGALGAGWPACAPASPFATMRYPPVAPLHPSLSPSGNYFGDNSLLRDVPRDPSPSSASDPYPPYSPTQSFGDPSPTTPAYTPCSPAYQPTSSMYATGCPVQYDEDQEPSDDDMLPADSDEEGTDSDEPAPAAQPLQRKPMRKPWQRGGVKKTQGKKGGGGPLRKLRPEEVTEEERARRAAQSKRDKARNAARKLAEAKEAARKEARRLKNQRYRQRKAARLRAAAAAAE